MSCDIVPIDLISSDFYRMYSDYPTIKLQFLYRPRNIELGEKRIRSRLAGYHYGMISAMFCFEA
jgi:hypothetical protein